MSNAIRTIAWQAVAASITLMFGLVGIAEAQQPKVRSSLKYTPPLGSAALLKASSAPLAAPLSQTFFLHSRPAATKVIYLDFDGHVTTGTRWNTANNAWTADTATITSNIWSIEGDNSFSNNELTIIQEVWQRVAECYSPFDVDVTTQQPAVADLLNTGGSDTKWGIRACIGTPSPAPPGGGGGWGLTPGFGINTGSPNDTPCFVFNISSAKLMADTTVHEVGHTLGLGHDGDTSFPAGDPQQRDEYYSGHGTGITGWAPHMGAAYSKNLAQFSKGEYPNANNTQLDLTVITTGNGFSFRTDDFASTQGAAASIAGATVAGTFNINQSGVIERNTDTDWFKIVCGSGNVILNAVGGPANTMLDIEMNMYNSSGGLIVSSNPTTDVIASITRAVSAGTYFVRIDGVGKTPLSTGYSDYGSLGQYTITGTYPAGSGGGGNVVTSYNATTKTLTLTGDVSSNAVSVTFAANAIAIAGVNGTKVNNKTTAQTYPHTGNLNLGATMSDGDDSITVVNVTATQLYFNLGKGSDTVTLNYCAAVKLNIDGGAGTDSLIKTLSTSTIPQSPPNLVKTNVEFVSNP